jgi:hypothetical protein
VTVAGRCRVARMARLAGLVTSSASVQGSYLAGSHDLAMGGSGGEPRRVVVRFRCCHFCCHRPFGRRWVGRHHDVRLGSAKTPRQPMTRAERKASGSDTRFRTTASRSPRICPPRGAALA